MLEIINFETLRENLVKENTLINFPKNTEFEFPQQYREIVTKIKTIEISAECILFDVVASVNATKTFSDLDYWNKDFKMENIKEYWFFGANGQGDSWVLDRNGNVFFHDHNQGEISKDNLIDLELNFEKWLQFAFLNKQFENLDYDGLLTLELKNSYKAKLEELSNGLVKNYPFGI